MSCLKLPALISSSIASISATTHHPGHAGTSTQRTSRRWKKRIVQLAMTTSDDEQRESSSICGYNKMKKRRYTFKLRVVGNELDETLNKHLMLTESIHIYKSSWLNKY